jgi:4-hydroxy-tetrahydrodipicolinate reductase
MSVSVVVLGVAGRMGATIAGMAQLDSELELAGVVERPQCAAGLESFVCTAGTDLDEVLPMAPEAVVIDFTGPEGTMDAVAKAARHGNSLVSGTTGLNQEQQDTLREAAKSIPVLWAPNMSVGINVLLRVLPELVRLLGENYDMEMVELHHKMKKDAPSGTAINLAQCLAEARNWDLDSVGCYSRHGIIGERPHEEIGVQTIRGGDVTGVHTVYFMGPGERIEVTHQAHSRENFAQGALRAAKWIAGKKPGHLYSMADVLK